MLLIPVAPPRQVHSWIVRPPADWELDGEEVRRLDESTYESQFGQHSYARSDLQGLSILPSSREFAIQVYVHEQDYEHARRINTCYSTYGLRDAMVEERENAS
mgnify:FL=1